VSAAAAHGLALKCVELHSRRGVGDGSPPLLGAACCWRRGCRSRCDALRLLEVAIPCLPPAPMIRETCVVTCAGGDEKAWLLRLCLLFWNPVLPSAGFKQFLLSSECCNALSDFCNIRA